LLEIENNNFCTPTTAENLKYMIRELEQKQGIFNSRKFILYSDRVHIETKSIRTNDSYEVKMEQIGYDKHYQSDSTIIGKIAHYIFIAIPIIVWIDYYFNPTDKKYGDCLFFTVIFWFIALLGYLKKNKDDIFLVGGEKNLVFYRAIPNEQEVLDFIETVVATSKKYIKQKYTLIDSNIPEELFMNRIYWLKEKEIITESELFVLKEEYNIQKLVS